LATGSLDIFEKRLLIISGKGGVGKSTICSALALGASRMDKRVLVIEMDERERISRLFGSAPVGYEGAFVHPNIFARNLLPMSAMNDFVETQVSVKRIAKQILGSPIYRYFVAAAPGLKEFVTLGRIMTLEQETDEDGEPRYDIIIVDAPATGHGVAFLRVPFAATDVLKAGWIRKQADDIIRLITDPEKTMLNIVTLPEEMPVNETMELCEDVEGLLGIPIGYIIINSVFPQVLKKRDATLAETMKKQMRSDGAVKLTKAERKCVDAMFECFEAAARRRELNEFYISRLKRKLKYDYMQVPFVFTPTFDIDLIEEVSAYMMQILGGKRRT
jgi:anion-transporting  ArsA/GET3 family ATPase